MTDTRWVEVTSSQFDHEREGLEYLRQRVPRESPYRVWTNFEFRDGHGRWHEVDALLLGQGALYLLELKAYRGTISGNDRVWSRTTGRSEDSPLLLARRKAQYLASKLKDTYREVAGNERDAPPMRQVIPWVQEAVFLHHRESRVTLPESSRINLYGLDETEEYSGLTGISDLIFAEPHRAPIGEHQEHILAGLLKRIGLMQRRETEAGSWVIEDGGALAEGEGWQDWTAYHREVQDTSARIRFHVTASDSGAEQRTAQLIADHEYRVMRNLHHEGLIRPIDIVSEDRLGRGLVYDWDPSLQRLDLWIADQHNGVGVRRAREIITKVGEVLAYAHGNGVVHRGLSPRTVWIGGGTSADVPLTVKVSDWQSAGSSRGEAATSGVTKLAGAGSRTDADDELSGFAAPEGRWSARSADRPGLDLFALGAIAFYVLTGRPPAESALDLTERLRAQDGLDLAVDLPEIGSTLRNAVLGATRRAPTARFRGVSEFLTALEEPDTVEVDSVQDPREAVRGDALADGRFTVVQRLGKGSTAVGLLVEDTSLTTKNRQRVLKVALDTDAMARIEDEAAVMRQLRSPRIAALIDGPLDLGQTTGLLLENAGVSTLQDELRDRGTRLSLDLLERFGDELMVALEALEKAGVDHRDIKPSNLGVWHDSSKRKHLKLFDFSLSRAPGTALEAGTPPYLDPFLGGDRARFDSSAERYSAGVVLFEMASGFRPWYGGDDRANPAVIDDDLTIPDDAFPDALQADMAAFFRTALARRASDRFDTARVMRETWQCIFSPETVTAPQNSDELVAAADLETPLGDSGLSARALSGLEVFEVKTVGDLLQIDRLRLNRMSGASAATKEEIKKRVREWTNRLGEPREPARPAPHGAALPSVDQMSWTLLAAVTDDKVPNRREMTELILGHRGRADAFARQGTLGGLLPKTLSQPAASQLLQTIQEIWAVDPDARQTLVSIGNFVDSALEELGDVATPDELITRLHAETPTVRDQTATTARTTRRKADGLLRLVADRRRYLLKAGTDDKPLHVRRHDQRVTAIARTPALLELADALGRAAEQSVELLGDEVLTPERSHEAVDSVLSEAESTIRNGPLQHGQRALRLAAGVSETAALSSAGELHRKDLSVVSAVRHAVGGMAAEETVSPATLTQRVLSRFPELETLPRRPRLDEVLRDAGLDLRFDDDAKVYFNPTVHGDTTGLTQRDTTVLGSPDVRAELDAGPISRRLHESISRRSYLVLGADPYRMPRLLDALRLRFDAQILDIAGLLIDELKRLSAEEKRVPAWDLLLDADAQDEASRPRQGLRMVVDMAMPEIESTIQHALATDVAQRGSASPVVLTDVAPLVRYGHGTLLRRLSDLTIARDRAVWIALPQFGIHTGPEIDGVKLSSSPNQFIRIDNGWIDVQASQDTEDRDAVPTEQEGSA